MPAGGRTRRQIMQKLGVLVLVVCAHLASGASAAAQDRGDTGVVMGYPASVAILWHATDRVALRPELTFAKGSTDDESSFGPVTTTDTQTIGLAVSALWYVTTTDNLRTYFSPRVNYSRTTTENQSVNGELTATTIGVAGSFGAQYALSPRFGVFGEVGLSYTDGHLEVNTSSRESDSWGVNTRSAVGVIVYF
jgi:hypothetical protein